MDNDRYLEAIRRDGAAFATSIAAGGLEARVPTCPEWTTEDLMWHLTEVHYFWSTVVAEQRQDLEDFQALERPLASELADAFDDRFSTLLSVLAGADPATEVWTWSADHSVGFVIRRMAQETAIHRWDAESAAGSGTAIDVETELASDGIDEFLTHFLPNGVEHSEPVGGSVHIHCSDVAGEWTIRPDAGGYAVTREHAKGDCALRGPASNLLLALWRRVGIESVDVVGDHRVAERFLNATKLD